jgi:hypothetical protein
MSYIEARNKLIEKLRYEYIADNMENIIKLIDEFHNNTYPSDSSIISQIIDKIERCSIVQQDHHISVKYYMKYRSILINNKQLFYNLSDYGYSLLFNIICSYQNMDLLKYLYYDEFNLDVLDKNRQTPLQFFCNYYRCNNKDYSIINYLLNCNVNIDHKDKNNDTALILAAEKNKPLIVQLLLDNGADITPINNAGLNCLYYIKHFDMYSISQEIYYKYYNILSNIRHNIFDTNLIIKIIINYI